MSRTRLGNSRSLAHNMQDCKADRVIFCLRELSLSGFIPLVITPLSPEPRTTGISPSIFHSLYFSFLKTPSSSSTTEWGLSLVNENLIYHPLLSGIMSHAEGWMVGGGLWGGERGARGGNGLGRPARGGGVKWMYQSPGDPYRRLMKAVERWSAPRRAVTSG